MRVLGWSESAYYARKKRPKSVRRLRDEGLTPLIEQVHAESGGTYGARRITRALRRKGVDVARCTVERLMRELGLEGVIRGQRRKTTVLEPSAPRPPDLVDRDFTASRPDQLWVADMTYVRTWSGWAYVAFVLDVYSRRIVGWQVATHMRIELPLDALEMALWRRRIKKDSGLIHHSDRGSRYVSIRYTDRLADIGASASVGSVADSYDNAMTEALNGTFKAELIEMQGPWKDVDQVERAIFQWVTWCNEERLHSALDYVPPAEYEQSAGDAARTVGGARSTSRSPPETRSPGSTKLGAAQVRSNRSSRTGRPCPAGGRRSHARSPAPDQPQAATGGRCS
jgi:transposase InsO family protein